MQLFLAPGAPCRSVPSVRRSSSRAFTLRRETDGGLYYADSYYHQLNSYTTSCPWCSYVTPGMRDVGTWCTVLLYARPRNLIQGGQIAQTVYSAWKTCRYLLLIMFCRCILICKCHHIHTVINRVNYEHYKIRALLHYSFSEMASLR